MMQTTDAGLEQYRQLMQRAATDLDFRRDLLSDPKTTVSRFTGQELPSDFSISFVENEADVTFVLPNAAPASGELSESDLEAVAGGVLPIVLTIASAYWLGGAAGAGLVGGIAYEASR